MRVLVRRFPLLLVTCIHRTDEGLLSLSLSSLLAMVVVWVTC